MGADIQASGALGQARGQSVFPLALIPKTIIFSNPTTVWGASAHPWQTSFVKETCHSISQTGRLTPQKPTSQTRTDVPHLQIILLTAGTMQLSMQQESALVPSTWEERPCWSCCCGCSALHQLSFLSLASVIVYSRYPARASSKLLFGSVVPHIGFQTSLLTK